MLSVSFCAVCSVSRHFSGTFRWATSSPLTLLLSKWQQQICPKVSTQSVDASAVFFFLLSQTSSSFSVFPHTSCTGIGTTSSSVHWLDSELLFLEVQRPGDADMIHPHGCACLLIRRKQVNRTHTHTHAKHRLTEIHTLFWVCGAVVKAGRVDVVYVWTFTHISQLLSLHV